MLNEHFRCASEIIEFSNDNFYDNQLIPLRLPTQSERITPSILDVRLPNGLKVGKVNEREADEIVRRVAEIVHGLLPLQRRRSIGIISLMGDEQSRLIRGRLLDTIGPQRMAQHSLLVGDPPSFQGTERDGKLSCAMVRALGHTFSQHFCRFRLIYKQLFSYLWFVHPVERLLKVNSYISNDPMWRCHEHVINAFWSDR